MAITWDCIAQFGTSGAWATASNWPTGGVPLATEHALLSSLSQAITGSDESAADLGTVWFDKACAHEVGSSSTPLILAVNRLVVEGTGRKYLKAGGAGIDYMVLNLNDSSQYVLVSPNTTALLTNLHLIRANAELAAEAGVIAYGRIEPGQSLRVPTGAGGFTALDNAGNVLSKALCTTLWNKQGGTYTQEYGAGATVVTAHCDGGSTFYFDHAGAITLLTAASGSVVDFNRNSQNKTVANCVLSPGATIKAGPHVAFTNPPIYGEV